jgi:hypothetical protein
VKLWAMRWLLERENRCVLVQRLAAEERLLLVILGGGKK